MVIAEINSISKSFGQVRAVSDVTFHVNKGEIFGLIGPDGAGKTTLFRMLTSLMKPDSGNAMINGLDVVRDFRKIRHVVGYMPGRFSLYQDLTVEENLSFYATVFGTTIEKNYDLIKDIYQHIEPFKNRRAGRLSGGMKQKLALSCALIHHPLLLVLDEPTTGVDAVSRKEFWEMLSGLKEKGITILVSTAYMDEASLCDCVGLIQNGHLFSVDTPGNILKNFQHNLYSIKSHDNYRLIVDLKSCPIIRTASLFGQGIHVTVNISEDPESVLNEYLKDGNHKGIIIERILPGIEDCFIELMDPVKK